MFRPIIHIRAEKVSLSQIVVSAAILIAVFTLTPSDSRAGEDPSGSLKGVGFAGFLPELLTPTDPGAAPVTLALADFNGDGILDMAVGDQTSDEFDDVEVFIGVGDGTFGLPTLYPVGGAPAGLAIADLNLDGRLDIVSSNYESSDVSVLRGTGDGTFLSEVFFGTGDGPRGIAVRDVNADGLPDIVTANHGADTISVLIGDGTGTSFTRTDFSTIVGGGTGGHDPIDMVMTDLNNDGLPDVAVAAQFDDQVVVMYNLGGGSFASGDFALVYPTGDLPLSIEAVDANGDGWMDLVNTNGWDDNIVVLTNNVDAGFPTFTPGTPIPVPGGPSAIAVADLNLDSVHDLVVTTLGPATDQVFALIGDGVGSFTTIGPWPVQLDPGSVAAGDLDRDGDPDVVTGNLNDQSISTLLNRTNIVGGPMPEAFIAAPIHLGCQCGLEDVFGVADVGSGMFDRWDLEYRATSVDAWTPLAESGTAVPSPGGLLTSWDTTLLAEGRYLLRLTVTSISGLTATDEVVVWISRDFDAASFDFLWGNVGMPSVATVVAGNACPIGTVGDNGCGSNSYTVDYSTLGGGVYIPIDPGNPTYAGGRANSSLATWDTIGNSIPDGDYDVRLVGMNACGHQALAFRTVRVDNTPPVASLEAPASCLVAHPGDLVEIRGTASDANLLSWNVSVVGGPYTSWHTLASGTSQVANGLLATLDTTGLPDCGYVLRLRVSDAAIPNCGSSPRDVVVYRTFGIGTDGCMFSDPFEIGATEHWDATVPVD